MKLRITLEGKSYEVDVEVLPEPLPAAAEPEGGSAVPAAVLASVLQPPHQPDTRPEDKICRSPIAGVVVSIAATVHQKLRQDDPVVTIEAMKMQTTIGAPMDGTVQEIDVMPGDAVKPGQVLCKLS